LNAIFSSYRGIGATFFLAAFAALAASGCGSASTPKAVTGTTTTPTAAAQATASPAQATLTGTKLNSMLLSARDLPAGFRPYTPGLRNSADGISPDSSSPVPAGQVCGRLTGTSWIEAAGIDGAAFAEREYNNSGRTETIGEEIDTFDSGDAQKVMSGLWKAFGQCKAFTQDYSGMQARTTTVRAKLPGAGDEAIKAVETSPTFKGGTTLVAIRIGSTIVTCIYSSEHSDLGAPAATWAERIGQRVEAVR
jgi:hypothetical protein